MFSYFKIKGVVPDMLLLLVVSLSVDKDDLDFFFVAACAGLFQDFYASAFPGTFMGAFLIAAYALHLTANSIVTYQTNWKYLGAFMVGAMAITFFWVWLYSMVTVTLGWWPQQISFGLLWRSFLPQLLYNSLLLYPVFNITRLLKSGLIKLFSRQQVIR